MFCCPISLFGYCPIIRIDFCVILWKKNDIFFLNFISYHIFAIYVGGASLHRAAEHLQGNKAIAVSGARTTCHRPTGNMFTIYVYTNTQRLRSCVYAYNKLRHEGFM